uniref:Uncharacterized protein n=1 Tax=Timema tahoe TaxID=61484 RepID=A0A7R9ITF6_9NEOP|nr:unnamed protein product [Timema tahoe]
MIYRMVQNF